MLTKFYRKKNKKFKTDLITSSILLLAVAGLFKYVWAFNGQQTLKLMNHNKQCWGDPHPLLFLSGNYWKKYWEKKNFDSLVGPLICFTLSLSEWSKRKISGYYFYFIIVLWWKQNIERGCFVICFRLFLEF